MNLENLNLVELNAQEMKEVAGGGILRWIGYLADAAGASDAIDDFAAGWDSVNTNGGFRPGGGSGGSW
jgi:hypothetical protein